MERGLRAGSGSQLEQRCSNHVTYIMWHTSLSTIIYNTQLPYKVVYLSRENVPSLPLLAPRLRQYCYQLLQVLHHNFWLLTTIISGEVINTEPRCRTRTCSTVTINIWTWVVWLNWHFILREALQSNHRGWSYTSRPVPKLWLIFNVSFFSPLFRTCITILLKRKSSLHNCSYNRTT